MTNATNTKIFDLPCFDGRKSFYRKAKVIERDGEKILISYNTEVAKIDKDGNYSKIWNGSSMTTNRHIKSFKIFYNIE